MGPKTLRASAGSAFRLPLGNGRTSGEWAETLTKAGFHCIAADAHGDTLYTAFDWTGPTALFLGGETGFSKTWIRQLPTIRIPLKPPVESLNVAVAAGVLLFEAARQRS
jgi:TrmH family RNA methyltransferase